MWAVMTIFRTLLTLWRPKAPHLGVKKIVWSPTQRNSWGKEQDLWEDPTYLIVRKGILWDFCEKIGDLGRIWREWQLISSNWSFLGESLLGLHDHSHGMGWGIMQFEDNKKENDEGWAVWSCETVKRWETKIKTENI